MKADIHPEYRPVVFQDTGANGWTFITRSTIETSDTIELDGTTPDAQQGAASTVVAFTWTAQTGS